MENTTVIPYNHSSSDIFEACGLSEGNLEEIQDRISAIPSEGRNSVFVENLENTLSKRELAFALYRALSAMRAPKVDDILLSILNGK